MKKYLLPREGTFYKANMHCHSTVSDGKLTPGELKAAYKERGYSIVAFTDHEVIKAHPELEDEEFLPITAAEIAFTNKESPFRFRKETHLNIYARQKNNTPDANAFFGEDDCRRHSTENINRAIKTARENGFIVCYNHPQWSLETIIDFSKYEGCFAMEVYNTGCDEDPFTITDEWNEASYCALCRMGRKIFPICSDDNHNGLTPDDRYYDTFGGFIMIKSGELKYDAVFSAIERGDFYASQRPEIYELYAEDGIIHIKTSPAYEIRFITEGRKGLCRRTSDKSALNSAEFEFPENDSFVYVMVTDFSGKRAFSRAYFKDEILL